MELRKINTNDIEAQWAYTTSLPTDENGLTNPYNGAYRAGEDEGHYFMRISKKPD